MSKQVTSYEQMRRLPISFEFVKKDKGVFLLVNSSTCQLVN